MKTIVKNWIENNSRANRQAVAKYAATLEAKNEQEEAFKGFAQVLADAEGLELQGGLADILYNVAFALASNLSANL